MDLRKNELVDLYGHKIIFKKFINEAAEMGIGVKEYLLNKLSDKNYTLQREDVIISMIYAAINSHMDIIDALFARGLSFGLADDDGFTALMFASDEGNEDIVLQLISYGCNLDERSIFGDTAIMLASANGHKDVVDILISYQCNIDMKNIYGWTALMQAARKGHHDIVHSLLTHNCDLEIKNCKGLNALMIAKRAEHTEIVTLIEDQIKGKTRRNDNWNRRKALMMLNHYLQATGPVQFRLSSEKVLDDLFLLQQIMKYI